MSSTQNLFSVGSRLIDLSLPENTRDPINPAAVLSLYRMPSHASLIELKGQAARKYVLELSDDLKLWAPISTNILNGNLIFVEERQATNQPTGFYRAIAR